MFWQSSWQACFAIASLSCLRRIVISTKKKLSFAKSLFFKNFVSDFRYQGSYEIPAFPSLFPYFLVLFAPSVFLSLYLFLVKSVRLIPRKFPLSALQLIPTPVHFCLWFPLHLCQLNNLFFVLYLTIFNSLLSSLLIDWYDFSIVALICFIFGRKLLVFMIYMIVLLQRRVAIVRLSKCLGPSKFTW